MATIRRCMGVTELEKTVDMLMAALEEILMGHGILGYTNIRDIARDALAQVQDPQESDPISEALLELEADGLICRVEETD